MDDNLKAKILREPTLVEPRFPKCPDLSGKTVVMAPMETDYRLLKQAFGQGAARRLYTANIVTDFPALPNAVLCGPFLGGSQAVMLLEVLAAKGVRRFIFYGICGALNGGMPAGSVFIADSALSDEGVARHYSRENIFEADGGLLHELRLGLETTGLEYSIGRMASTDAVFRETTSLINYYRDRECVAVDMEAAALYAAARYHNLAVCGIFAVSDVFDGGKWHAGFNSAELKNIRGRMAAIIKEMVNG